MYFGDSFFCFIKPADTSVFFFVDGDVEDSDEYSAKDCKDDLDEDCEDDSDEDS